ncbi:MAG: cyclic nucleotide-binding domain-containing protein [bacterium]|nr:cyclic nucleotide-binding domain-containing protein [bacterium]
MSSIPVITSDSKLFGRLERCRSDAGLQSPLAWVPERPLERLQTELPDLFIIDLSDPVIDIQRVILTVRNDPWLFGGGIVALGDEDLDSEWVETSSEENFLALVSKERIERDLPRILRIIQENPRLLFQRVVGPDLVPELSGRFVFENDPVVARCYEGLICNFLYNANRIDGDTRDALSFAMYELLLNAIEHGNCGIGYEEKGAWLESGKPMLELIELRIGDPRIAGRRVSLAYDISAERSRFRITDEGEGFDWRQRNDRPDGEPFLRAHGRGIQMTRSITDQLGFNERGNEVAFEVAHQRDVANATPALLEGLLPQRLAAGDVLMGEGDAGDTLYFISRGRFDVVAGGTLVAELGPDDLIAGEMSFLLRGPRNATVTARTKAVVVAVSYTRFVEAIREKPYYALLLARLMAERLQRVLRRGVRELIR